jgi:hypothetical protein
MKLTISRLLETSKYLATEAGQQLSDFIQAMADLTENVVRILNNGLTFGDNFNCKVATLSLRNNVEQVVNTDGKRAIGVIVLQSISTTTAVQSLISYTNNSGQFVVKPSFVGSPTNTIDVNVAILFP